MSAQRRISRLQKTGGEPMWSRFTGVTIDTSHAEVLLQNTRRGRKIRNLDGTIADQDEANEVEALLDGPFDTDDEDELLVFQPASTERYQPHAIRDRPSVTSSKFSLQASCSASSRFWLAGVLTFRMQCLILVILITILPIAFYSQYPPYTSSSIIALQPSRTTDAHVQPTYQCLSAISTDMPTTKAAEDLAVPTLWPPWSICHTCAWRALIHLAIFEDSPRFSKSYEQFGLISMCNNTDLTTSSLPQQRVQPSSLNSPFAEAGLYLHGWTLSSFVKRAKA